MSVQRCECNGEGLGPAPQLQLSRDQGVACSDAGMDEAAANAAIQAASKPAAKEALQRQTQEAIDAGAFGLPFMVLEGEDVPKDCRKWFGADRLEQIAVALDKPWLRGPAQTAKL